MENDKNDETVGFKKRFDDASGAMKMVYRLRRHGIDAFRRGAVCTAILSTLTTPNWRVMHLFGGDWNLI